MKPSIMTRGIANQSSLKGCIVHFSYMTFVITRGILTSSVLFGSVLLVQKLILFAFMLYVSRQETAIC